MASSEKSAEEVPEKTDEKPVLADNPRVVVSGKPGYGNKHKLLSVCLIIMGVLLVAVAGQALYERLNPQPAFVIDGKKYSKKDVTAVAMSVSRSNGYAVADNAKRYYDFLRLQAAAQKAGVQPSASEIAQTAIAKKFPSSKDKALAQWVGVASFANALDTTYQRLAQGGYQGYAFIFDFSQMVFPESPDLNDPNHGNQAVIASDQSYATERATFYRGQLVAKSLTPDQIIQAINKDTRINNIEASSKFNSSITKQTLSSQLMYTDIYTYVTSQSKPGLSAVRVGKVETTLTPKKASDYAPGYVYFVQLDKATKTRPDARAQVAQQLSQLKATYYGI